MIIEMHCHTAEHSACSSLSAVDLVQHNFEKGLHGSIITDHHYLWSDQEISELRSRLRVPDFYLIISGQEVSTPEFGDVLVYGARRSFERGTSVSEIRKEFPDAAIVLAHPYRNERRPSPDLLLNPILDGVEIFNSNHTVAESARGLRDWHKLKFTALAGTDVHAVGYAGLYPTLFDHPVSSSRDVAAEIRRGRCRPYFEEIPLSGTSNTRVLELTTGPEIKADARQKYIVKTHENVQAWRSAARSAAVVSEMARRGFDRGKFRVPLPLGQDRDDLIVIEQGIEGRSLFHKLLNAGSAQAETYMKMTAEWIARLHNMKLQITPPDEFLSDEPLRLERYLSAFYRIGHRHTRKAQEIMDAVLEAENALYCRNPERLVQGHGDYHPRNILIGEDPQSSPPQEFIAAIDFDSSYTMPPAFDVGTFLAQFQNQFYDYREVLSRVPEDVFVNRYLESAEDIDPDFLRQVELFRARTSLSIAYYLIKVGLGDSENLWRVLVLAEQGLARLSV